MNVEPEMEFRPEVEYRQEMDIPAETCEGALGAARPITDIASQYIAADKPKVTASYTSQEPLVFPSSIPKPLPFTHELKHVSVHFRFFFALVRSAINQYSFI